LLTKDQIKKYLENDPYWEPDEDATHIEWELYDEVCDKMEKTPDEDDENDEDTN